MLPSESTFGKTFFMSTKYKFRDNDELYFVTFTVVYWFDVFIRNEYKEIFLDSLKYCIANKGLEVCCWCIMTSHVHLIIGSNKEKLPDIVRDMKIFTSLKIIQAIKNNKSESRRDWLLWMMQRAGPKNGKNNKFQFWIQHSHPIVLDTPEILWQRLDYIHNNPVVSRIVLKAEEFVYSSAYDYFYDQEGKVPLRRINGTP